MGGGGGGGGGVVLIIEGGVIWSEYGKRCRDGIKKVCKQGRDDAYESKDKRTGNAPSHIFFTLQLDSILES